MLNHGRACIGREGRLGLGWEVGAGMTSRVSLDKVPVHKDLCFIFGGHLDVFGLKERKTGRGTKMRKHIRDAYWKELDVCRL